MQSTTSRSVSSSRAIRSLILSIAVAGVAVALSSGEGESSLPRVFRPLPTSTTTPQSDVADPQYPPCGTVRVYNTGEIGKSNEHDLRIGCSESDPIYDGTFVLVADSNSDGVVVRYSTFGNLMFVPELAAVSGECGFDSWESEPLGYSRTGGCPGTPRLILGSISNSSYSDTLFASSTGPFGCPAAAGVTVAQTVTVADAAPYNDFILYRWEIINRDGFAKGPWYAGSYIDFDVPPIISSEIGWYSNSSNGYVIWNSSNPSLGYGMLDPNQPAGYDGIDPGTNPAYAVGFKDLQACVYLGWCPFFQPYCEDMIQTWRWIVRHHCGQAQGPFPVPGDRAGILINPSFSLGPYDSTAVHQALYWIDASSNDPAVIEANMQAVASRAARWAGFARGDVNDDGLVDLADVAWLIAGLPIYPDTYSGDVDIDGDVDADDTSYLLRYVSGTGPAPQGRWRFALPD